MGKKHELAGKTFGRLTVLKEAGRNKQGEVLWKCRCSCGKETVVNASSLIQGRTKSCGCGIWKDLAGKRFGKLTAIRIVGKTSTNMNLWLCKCDCGSETVVSTSHLTSGHTKSCGCLKIEQCGQINFKHGLAYHPLYMIWLNMKQRCYNPKNKSYPDYGGRGICIADCWKDDPEAFINYCIALGYKKGLEIDRINNNGNYEPGNIRFTNKSVQASNRRPNKTKTLQYIGISDRGSYYWARVRQHGKTLYDECFPCLTCAVLARDMFIQDNNLPHTRNLLKSGGKNAVR